jgi:adenylate cyclase
MQHAKAGEAVDPGGRAAAGAMPSGQGRRWRPQPLTLNRLRLATGLWLLLFAATHLANHALGLVSLATAEAGRVVFLAFWRLPPIEASLLAALLLHAALGLAKLWQRRTLRLSLAEVAQLVFALLIPIYLTGHVLGTGWLHRCCGVEDSYTYFVGRSWSGGAASQTVLTLLVWLHGAIGLHQWLRLRPGYRRLQPYLLVAAALLPALALAGFASAGREAAVVRALEPTAWAELAEVQRWPDEATRAAELDGPERWILRGFFGLVAFILALRTVRWLRERRRHVRLTYPGGRQVSVPRGLTILEASQLMGVPHAAVCGGRGRCSTCRVRVGAGSERLPPPAAEERRVLARIGAGPDVRLARQARPAADLVLTPLMPAAATARDALSPMDPSQGVEREVAVLFADLRGFTRLSEGRLPYDTVFILNRYFDAMGEAIEGAGGRVDKFIGDGVMALFGVEAAPTEAARASLAAARGMALGLQALNRQLAVELDEPLRMGMGVHLGQAIVGEIGHGRAASLTAIGDTVNVASRLEALTKELGCQLVASVGVVERAGPAFDGWPRREVDVRGRVGRLEVSLVEDAASLPELGRPREGEARRRWRQALPRLGVAGRRQRLRP